ncbi:hypothetical protein BU16DRAFT_566686 [Lophium mytilinum]|uniref:Protein kinase domain-containing protein n=1 Tax=Lophium mytilinum TaxID=390894 RepID=A0A6A6QD29_9PEZI|nr:hypothetical protein BU16DRAFT_566686 [Lophium mytilinum]
MPKPFPLLTGQVAAGKEDAMSEPSSEPETHPYDKTLPPKLEECLSEGSFPTLLLVHDPDNCTSIEVVKWLSDTTVEISPTDALYSHCTGVIKDQGNETTVAPDNPDTSKVELKPFFERRIPALLGPWPPWQHRHEATLTLSFRNLVGVGHHAAVYRASLKLSDVVGVNGRSKSGEVPVIAKLNYLVSDDNENNAHMLKKEANTFQKSMGMCSLQQEAYLCLYHSNLIEGVTTLSHRGHCVPPVLVTPPVLPKFFGYYKWGPKSSELGRRCKILLMEDCGQSLETYMELNDEESIPVAWMDEIKGLYKRLHGTGFMHGSVWPRNITIQPGPLSSPPSARSMDMPSFRIIDLGRARHVRDCKRQPVFREQQQREKLFLANRLPVHHEPVVDHKEVGTDTEADPAANEKPTGSGENNGKDIETGAEITAEKTQKQTTEQIRLRAVEALVGEEPLDPVHEVPAGPDSTNVKASTKTKAEFLDGPDGSNVEAAPKKQKVEGME